MALPHHHRWLTQTPIAHRGLHDEAAPENTLAAFERAVNASMPIELDVQRLGDGTLVVFHDYDLRRASGRPEALSKLTIADLPAVRVFGSDQGIATLGETLDFVAGRSPLLIEFKHGALPATIARAAFAPLARYRGLFAVQSFDPHLLAALRRALPGIPTGQIAGPLRESHGSRLGKLSAQTLLTTAISRPDFVNYDLRALPSRWVHAVTTILGLPLIAWTVRSPEDRHKAERLGLNYVFDRP